ncbi:MAG TPA: hypothetical protein VGC42_04950 [Kofleriaceae bacterium]
MRTAIYVYSNVSLTFSASETLTMTSYAHDNTTISGTAWTCSATPGIYKVVSNGSVTVTSPGDITVIAAPNDKDPFPDPPPRALNAFGVSNTDVGSFFAITNAKSIAF